MATTRAILILLIILFATGCSRDNGSVFISFYKPNDPGPVYQLLSSGNVLADSQLFEDRSQLYPILANQKEIVIVVAEPSRTDCAELDKLLEEIRSNVSPRLRPARDLHIYVSLTPIFEVVGTDNAELPRQSP